MTQSTYDIVNHLKHISSDKYKTNVIKLGIPEEDALGVPTSELRKIARTLPKDKLFLYELWKTGYHECKLLTVLSLKPKECTENEILALMEEIDSWDLCDLFCKTILIKRDFDFYIHLWIQSEELFKRRAAFTLIASKSTHAKLSDEEIADYLKLIEQHSDDERLLVKKAASWALRELGKISYDAKERSIETATALLQQPSKTQQWIAKEALKELQTLVKVDGRSRLISNKSKMGKEVSNPK
ncbi:hypothetical protein NRIC_23580 [Enterococcus florum]|uniref:DNA alkylation repair protein n=1 Tax=Enterococcus florum TaxID=2480627 RepID=A0A4P5P8V3_9ENTE|nr:DNA alkylation repair protein [Enterococcus florum]GCF94467.1 hypothetical protein NRIC_23580 [Enterococcus florum]